MKRKWQVCAIVYQKGIRKEVPHKEMIGHFIEPFILFLGATICLIWGIKIRNDSIRFKEKALYTTATILKYDHEMILDTSVASSSHQPAETVYIPTICFETDGVEKIVQRRCNGGYPYNTTTKFPSGSTIGVYYLADSPEDFHFEFKSNLK